MPNMRRNRPNWKDVYKRQVQVHGDNLVQVTHFRFVQIVFSNGDIRFADAAFGGVFPCGQPHVRLGTVGTAIYDRGGGMMGDRIVELILHRCEKLLCCLLYTSRCV